MIKKLIFLFIILNLICFLLSFIFLKQIIEYTVSKYIGFKIKIGQLNFNPLEGRIALRELSIYNPPQFREKVMAYLPLLKLNFKWVPFLKGNIVVTDMFINISAINIIKIKGGYLNITALKSFPAKVNKGKKEKLLLRRKSLKEKSKIKIAHLRIKIGKIIYKDYSKKPYKIKKFNINSDREYYNIENIRTLRDKILVKLTLEYLRKKLRIDIEGLEAFTGLANPFKDFWEGLKEGIGGILEKIK